VRLALVIGAGERGGFYFLFFSLTPHGLIFRGGWCSPLYLPPGGDIFQDEEGVRWGA